MPTIHDVARKANVSVMTVSRAMNKPKKVSAATIEKIHRVMEELGYQPSHIARSLVRQKTNTIGIIMPDIKNTFFNSWFRWVENYARSFQYNLLLCNTDENVEHEMQHVRFLQSHRVDGIMLVAHAADSVHYLKRSRMPYVLIDRSYDGIDSDYITTDHYAGALEATEYLLGLGHRRIGILKGPGILFPDVERFRGYVDALKKHKLSVDPTIIRNCEFQEGRSFEAVTELLKGENPPTAIFSFNSLMTIGAINAIDALDLSIPKDVSLVSFDEIPGHSIFRPTMTYVLQPIEDLGRNATRILLEKIEHPTARTKHRVRLKPVLVIGESCRRLRKAE